MTKGPSPPKRRAQPVTIRRTRPRHSVTCHKPPKRRICTIKPQYSLTLSAESIKSKPTQNLLALACTNIYSPFHPRHTLFQQRQSFASVAKTHGDAKQRRNLQKSKYSAKDLAYSSNIQLDSLSDSKSVRISANKLRHDQAPPPPTPAPKSDTPNADDGDSAATDDEDEETALRTAIAHEIDAQLQHFRALIAVGDIVSPDQLASFYDRCIETNQFNSIIEAFELFDAESYSPDDIVAATQTLRRRGVKPPSPPRLSLNIYSTTLFACGMVGNASLAYTIMIMMGVDENILTDSYNDDCIHRLLNLSTNNELLPLTEANHHVLNLYSDLCHDMALSYGITPHQVHDHLRQGGDSDLPQSVVDKVDFLKSPDPRYKHRSLQEFVDNPYINLAPKECDPAFKEYLIPTSEDPYPNMASPALTSYAVTLCLVACIKSARNLAEVNNIQKAIDNINKVTQHDRDQASKRRQQSSSNALDANSDANSADLEEPPTPVLAIAEKPNASHDTAAEIDAITRAILQRVLYHESARISPSHVALAANVFYSLGGTHLNSLERIFHACSGRQLPIVPQGLFALMHIAHENNRRLHLLTYFDSHFISPQHASFSLLAHAIKSILSTRDVLKDQGRAVRFTASSPQAQAWFESLDPYTQQMYNSDGGPYGLASRFGHLILPNFLHTLSTFSNSDGGIDDSIQHRRSASEIWAQLLSFNPSSTADSPSQSMTYDEKVRLAMFKNRSDESYDIESAQRDVDAQEKRINARHQPSLDLLSSDAAMPTMDELLRIQNEVATDSPGTATTPATNRARGGSPATSDFSPIHDPSYYANVLPKSDTHLGKSIIKPIFYTVVLALHAMRGLPYSMWSPSHDPAPTLWRESLLLSELLQQFSSSPDRYAFSFAIESALNADQPWTALWIAQRLLQRDGRVRVRMLNPLLLCLQNHILPATSKTMHPALLSLDNNNASGNGSTHSITYKASDSSSYHQNRILASLERGRSGKLNTSPHRFDLDDANNNNNEDFNAEDISAPVSPTTSQRSPSLESTICLVTELVNKALSEPIEYALHHKRLELGLDTQFYENKSFSTDQTNLETISTRIVEHESEDERDITDLRLLQHQLHQLELEKQEDNAPIPSADTAVVPHQHRTKRSYDESEQVQIYGSNRRLISAPAALSLLRIFATSGNSLLSLSIISEILAMDATSRRFKNMYDVSPAFESIRRRFMTQYNPQSSSTKQLLSKSQQSDRHSFSQLSQSHLVPGHVRSILGTARKIRPLHQFIDQLSSSTQLTSDLDFNAPASSASTHEKQAYASRYINSMSYHPHVEPIFHPDLSHYVSQTLLTASFGRILHLRPGDLDEMNNPDTTSTPLQSETSFRSDPSFISHLKALSRCFEGTSRQMDDIDHDIALFPKETASRPSTDELRTALSCLVVWAAAQTGPRPVSLTFLGHISALVSIAEIGRSPHLIRSLINSTSGGSLAHKLEWAGLKSSKTPVEEFDFTVLLEPDGEKRLRAHLPARRRLKAPLTMQFAHNMAKIDKTLSARLHRNVRHQLALRPEVDVGFGDLLPRSNRIQLQYVYLLAIENILKSGVMLTEDQSNNSTTTPGQTVENKLYHESLQVAEYAPILLKLYNLGKKRFLWPDLEVGQSYQISPSDNNPSTDQTATEPTSLDQFIASMPTNISMYRSYGGYEGEEAVTVQQPLTLADGLIDWIQLQRQSPKQASNETTSDCPSEKLSDDVVLHALQKRGAFLFDARQKSLHHGIVSLLHVVDQLEHATKLASQRQHPDVFIFACNADHPLHSFEEMPLISRSLTPADFRQNGLIHHLLPSHVTLEEVNTQNSHHMSIFKLTSSPL